MNADHEETKATIAAMEESARRLKSLAVNTGMAMQIIDYDSDRRKMALAKACRVVASPLHMKDSQGYRESQARTSEAYVAEIGQLGNQLASAYSQKCMWEAEKANFEAKRSVLSFQKQVLIDI